jgi:hypothetical protein
VPGPEPEPDHQSCVLLLLLLLLPSGEFHRNNKILVREAGGLRALGRLLAAAADVPEGELLRMGLAPAIAQSAGAIAQLAQDCEENQRHLLSQDLAILPVLFRWGAAGLVGG